MAEALCPAQIKDRMGRKQVCSKSLFKGECPDRLMHITKYKSGACGIGCHEGTNPKNFRDKPLPTCALWQTCGCECHDTFDQMYQMAERERELVNNSSYSPEATTFIMPDYAELAASRMSSITTPATAPKRIESELPDAVPATIARPYAPTPTGRAAKGELESQVKWACDVWLVDEETFNCTPMHISSEIGRHYGIKNPSVGAIDAVWKRWILIGFAEIEKKPTRFVRYTEDGIKLTLEGCKERAKRLKRSRA